VPQRAGRRAAEISPFATLGRQRIDCRGGVFVGRLPGGAIEAVAHQIVCAGDFRQ
jgi:hypothetical protein